MSPPKLPPLPTHVGEESHGPSQQPVKLYDGEQMQAYAIAAIEAQGVPDHCDPSCTSYKLAAMVMSDCGHSTNNQRLLDRIAARIDKHTESLLASAPPAHQAESPCACWPGRMCSRSEQCAKDVKQASVVQQDQTGLREAVFSVLEGFTLPHDVRKILESAYYTYHAKQAKPQPLSDEQIELLMRSIGTTYADDNDERMKNHAGWQRMNHRQIVRAIEAAHGIVKE